MIACVPHYKSCRCCATWWAVGEGVVARRKKLCAISRTKSPSPFGWDDNAAVIGSGVASAEVQIKKVQERYA